MGCGGIGDVGGGLGIKAPPENQITTPAIMKFNIKMGNFGYSLLTQYIGFPIYSPPQRPSFTGINPRA